MRKATSISFLFLVLFYALVLSQLIGCEVELSGSVKSRGFYPDNVGSIKIGDPQPRLRSYEESKTVEGNVDLPDSQNPDTSPNRQ